MVSFFPAPYPDELLYSTLARYYLRSVNASPKAALDDLFGSKTVIATYDLPSHLEGLVSNLPPLSTHTVEGFIERHTLLPLYAPFLPPERALLVLNSMRSHFKGDIHNRVGIMAGVMPIYRYFRFCSVCLQEEVRKYGEPYWHRLHQIPGIYVCPDHRVLLQNSTVKIKGENRHEFYAADESNCLSKPVAVSYSNDTFNKLLLLAQDVELLLNAPLESRIGEWYRKKYQSSLIDRGLAAPSGRVFQFELLREFNEFYGTEFLTAVHSNIESDEMSNWLSGIVRKHRKTFHPIRHLLLIRFLGQDVNSFFSNDQSSKPFGIGPWVCFNGSSNHYLERTVKSLTISYSSDAKKMIGTFSCQCGFIYSTSDPSVPHSNKLSFGKIKSFGKIWERKLTELLIKEKNSFRKTAKSLKVDTNTVINHAKRLNLVSLTKKDDFEKNNHSASNLAYKRAVNRNAWKTLTKDNPCSSKTELRKALPALYIWLYRNDRKWLDKNSPKKKRINPNNKRVDWLKRDKEVLLLTQKAVKTIFEKDPPVRVTISSVGKTIGLRALMEKHIKRLPETAAFLDGQVETVEAFQIRRVLWAVTKLESSGEYIVPWKVIRLAGLKIKTSERLYTRIEQVIKEATLKKLHGRKLG
ncbi:MAG: TnsD family transposase [Pyrinomonadaceae bacterium]|nr:TnsD family transposase [Pyrinomonadaceae bacterium]